MSKKKVVVTGGSGFLGSHLADRLTANGFDVTIFDRNYSPYLKPGQTMFEGDLLDYEAVAAGIAGAEYIFHLAGFADLNAARTRPLATAQLNVIGTVQLLKAAVQAQVKRFLFASTVYVYSRAGGFYRCSKQACEAYIEEFQQQYGLEYTILRFGSLYGPHADETNGVYRLLKQARSGKIRHTGQPDDSREYIHIEDAANLSIEALDEAYANQHIVLTGHHPIRLHDLFTMFSEILGQDVEIEYLEPPPGHSDGHYSVTPYSFNPRVGRKLTSNYYVDMGQGILQILEQMDD